jgi:hypothetical protein
MAGTQIFTYANFGKESTRGTPVAPTRGFYAEGTGLFEHDLGQDFHEGENAGLRLRTRRVTNKQEDVRWNARTVSGVAYDDLVIPFSQLKGGVTGTGASADKTWTFTPSWTAANNPEAWSIDVGDDTQNWRIQYGMVQRFRLAAGIGDLTSLEMEGFGQRAVKGAKAAPAANSGIKIPGDLWTVKFAANIAGLGAASVQTAFLTAFDLEVMTGLRWRHYLDGNLYGGQHQETDIAATLNMTVESTALAVSQFYDKAVAGTMDFLRLKATGPSLGSSNYSAQIDMPVLYEVPRIIAQDDDGVNLYQVTARLAYDGTNGIIPVIVNSLSALP